MAAATRTPPMIPGLPLLGSLLEWRRDHLSVYQQAYQRFGPVFSIRLGPQKGIVLIGPKYHEFYFREVDRQLSVPELYRFVVPMFGDVLMAATDADRRRRHVTLLQSAFQGGRLARYYPVMVEEVDAWLAGLGEAGSFELWDTFESLVMRIAAAALMGPEIRARVEAFRPLLVDLARGMEFVLPPYLPLPKFFRRDRARRLLTDMLRPVLAERRAHPGQRSDFLQALVDDPGLLAEGDEVQVGMALCTIFTGYITTAAQACWTLALLIRHRDYLDTVVAELVGAADGPGGLAAALVSPARTPRLEWAVKEAVRLQPVMGHYARTNAVDIELDGYLLPRGWLTMLCPGVAHRLPEIFADPQRYDPERFGPGRAEDKQPHALIGFSGGFYRCPGQAFGTNEIKVLVGLLLRRYELAPLGENPVADVDLGVSRPRSPTLVRYKSRRLGHADTGDASTCRHAAP
jgi:sterol 14alpha-demethylase